MDFLAILVRISRKSCDIGGHESLKCGLTEVIWRSCFDLLIIVNYIRSDLFKVQVHAFCRIPDHDLSLPPNPGPRAARAGDGRRPAGQLRPSRHADGHGRHRRGALAPSPEARSGHVRLGRPRPLRALQRPRLDAALRAAAPERLRPVDRRPEGLPPAAQPHAGPPGTGLHAGRRDHHRPAGPGHRQRGRHGASRAVAGGRIQPPRPCGHRPPHLGLPGRRLPDGRRQPRGLRAGRHLGPGQADRLLGRQRHLDRRSCRRLVQRGHPRPLRGLRLACGARRRRP